MIVIAAMILAQAPVAGAVPVAKKKPEQICQYIEVTGSHQRQRVCQDKNSGTDQNVDFVDAPAGMLKAPPPTVMQPNLGTPR